MDKDSEVEYTNLLKQSGLNVEQLELQERKDVEATEKWIAEVTPALLRGHDRTWIRVRTCLYLYVKGGGSYAKLDFSTGSNKICAHPLFVGGPLKYGTRGICYLIL